jgi:hypothetical protein
MHRITRLNKNGFKESDGEQVIKYLGILRSCYLRSS